VTAIPTTPAPAPAPAAAPAAAPIPGGRAGLRQAVRSEWTKFWSVRSTAWSLAATVFLVLGICVLANATAANNGLHVPDPTRRSLVGFLLGQFAIGVLGVLVISAEYSTGSIRSTLAGMPRRPVVIAAKVVVFGAVALVVSEVLAFSAFFIGQALLSRTGYSATLSQPGVTQAVLESGLYLTALGLLALGMATVIRHTAGAIAAFAGILLVLPLVVPALPTSMVNAITRYLPANIGITILSSAQNTHIFSTPEFSASTGLAILAGYAAAMLVLGGWLMVKRDA
jgi:ABC-2 type transport system permease protein